MRLPVRLVVLSAARSVAQSAVSTGRLVSPGHVTIAIGGMSTARLIVITGTIAIITDGADSALLVD